MKKTKIDEKNLVENFLSAETGKPDSDRLEKMFKEYLVAYRRCQTEPSMRDHLKQSIKVWFAVKDLENTLDHMEIASKKWISATKLWISLITEWSKLLVRLGSTYTSQQYIPVNEREVQPASELIEVQQKMKDIQNVVNEKTKEARKRLNKGGARRPKDGIPQLIKKKKEKKEAE